jgi:hypothetical protein
MLVRSDDRHGIDQKALLKSSIASVIGATFVLISLSVSKPSIDHSFQELC